QDGAADQGQQQLVQRRIRLGVGQLLVGHAHGEVSLVESRPDAAGGVRGGDVERGAQANVLARRVGGGDGAGHSCSLAGVKVTSKTLPTGKFLKPSPSGKDRFTEWPAPS